jgi:hypothetical protein
MIQVETKAEMIVKEFSMNLINLFKNDVLKQVQDEILSSIQSRDMIEKQGKENIEEMISSLHNLHLSVQDWNSNENIRFQQSSSTILNSEIECQSLSQQNTTDQTNDILLFFKICPLHNNYFFITYLSEVFYHSIAFAMIDFVPKY